MLRPLRLASAALVTTALLLCAASSASAYTYFDECGPTWDELPLTYYIDESGTEHYPDITDVEAAIQSSFRSWTDPCCTHFDASYGGLVDPDGIDDDSPVLSFYDDQWPASYGGPDTLAVTMVLLDEDCHIAEAPIHFNSAHHDFVDGDEESLDGDAVDLEAVAAHEVGHLLGLGHSEFLEATMYAAYLGGTEPRRLHDDDVDGVCSLYPDECLCIDDEDCRTGEFCDDGACADDPCAGDDDCPFPLVCDDGDCRAAFCDDDNDCAGDLVCHNARCVTACPACRPCTDHADCGHQGYCRIFPHGGRCMIACTSDGECPGDSVCTDVEQGQETFPLCTAPDADHPNEYCPEDYICADFDDGFEPCPGIGKSCSNQNFECSPDNDICLEVDSDLLCSCSCATDADCGGDHRCVDIDGHPSACLPAISDECGADTDCKDGEICTEGECQKDDSGEAIDARESTCSSTPGGTGGWIVVLVLLVAARSGTSSRR